MPIYRNYFNNQDDNSISRWANNNLTPAELVHFKQAERSNNHLRATDGLVVSYQLIYEDCYSQNFQQNIDIPVGYELETKDGASIDDIPLHEDFVYWVTRYNNRNS
jgi:hypothetical protein